MPEKKQYTIKMLGITDGGTIATPEDTNITLYAAEAEGRLGYFQLDLLSNWRARLTTPKGVYPLKADKAGIYRGIAKGNSVQVTLKNNEGELKFWA